MICKNCQKNNCIALYQGLCKECFDAKPRDMTCGVPYAERQAKRKKTLALIKTEKNAKRAAIRRRKKRRGKL